MRQLASLRQEEPGPAQEEPEPVEEDEGEEHPVTMGAYAYRCNSITHVGEGTSMQPLRTKFCYGRIPEQAQPGRATLALPMPLQAGEIETIRPA